MIFYYSVICSSCFSQQKIIISYIPYVESVKDYYILSRHSTLSFSNHIILKQEVMNVIDALISLLTEERHGIKYPARNLE